MTGVLTRNDEDCKMKPIEKRNTFITCFRTGVFSCNHLDQCTAVLTRQEPIGVGGVAVERSSGNKRIAGDAEIIYVDHIRPVSYLLLLSRLLIDLPNFFIQPCSEVGMLCYTSIKTECSHLQTVPGFEPHNCWGNSGSSYRCGSDETTVRSDCNWHWRLF